jgi:hypothetical protein
MIAGVGSVGLLVERGEGGGKIWDKPSQANHQHVETVKASSIFDIICGKNV